MITQIKLDESAKLEFGVSITGADGIPVSRFIIEGKEFSILLPCKQVNENLEVEVPELKKFFSAGEYAARLEVILDNKIYTPLQETIVFDPVIEVASKVKPTVQVKESVKVGSFTVKKSVINENHLRKVQAATIVAQALKYVPEKDETPKEIIEHAVAGVPALTPEQAKTLKDMLDLAESVGIEFQRMEILEKTLPVPQPKSEDDDVSDDELDDIVNGLSDDDYYDAYDDAELAVVDDETGEECIEGINEAELNEVLSRVERLRAKIRMARTATKRTAKLKIALKRRSTGTVLNRRARHMAVKAMELKIAKKPLNTLSVVEKERIERIIARKKNVINRLALRMLPKVRSIEKDRLSHPTFTKN